MKRLLLSLLSVSLFAFANAQVAGVELELVQEHTGPYTNIDDTVEDLTGFKTYRLYALVTNPDDFVVEVNGEATRPILVSTTTSWYHSPFGAEVGSSINPAFYPISPALVYDTWVTIGKESSTDPGSAVTTVGTWFPQFEAGGDIDISDIFGGAWFILPNPGNQPVNGLPDANNRVLIGQFTTDGDIVGYVNVTVYINGNNENINFEEGLAFTSIEGAVLGCNDSEATNFDPDATVNDGSCVFPCALQASLNITNPLCSNGTTGSFQVVAAGAQAGVTYQLNGGNVLGNPNYNNVPVGNHLMLVSDGVGCQVELNFAIQAPAPIVVTPQVVSQVTCNGAANGVLGGTVSGGTGELTFSLSSDFSNPITELNFTNLTPGPKVIYVIDENGCTGQSTSVNITQPTAIQGSITGSSPASCAETEDGVLVVQFFGGAGGFTFSTDGENFAAGNLINVGPGTYTVFAQDANGCVVESNNQVTLSSPAPIALSPSVTNPLCAGDETGAISGMATGGNGGFTYTVNDGESSNMLTASDLGDGVYTITVLDSEGCTASFEAVVQAPAAVTVGADASDIFCFGDNNGAILATAGGGVGGFSYTLNGTTENNDGEFADLEPGSYTIDVVDANGCEASTTADIAEPSALTIDGSATEETFSGAANGTATLSVDGGTAPYSYDWSGPNGFTSDDASIDGLSAGAYSVVVIDANGCEIEFSTEVTVSVGELENGVSFSIYPNPNNGVFFLNIDGLSGQRVQYSILDAAGRLIDRAELNASASFRKEIDMANAQSGLYFIRLIIGDSVRTVRIVKQN